MMNWREILTHATILSNRIDAFEDFTTTSLQLRLAIH